MNSMSINRALSELKLLNKKIGDKTEKLRVAASADMDTTEDLKNGFLIAAKADLQQVQDFIARRNAIKAAIVESNATTTVKVSDKTMTVAAAIERKASIEYEKRLCRVLREQYYGNKQAVEQSNEGVKRKADLQVEGILGAESTRDKSDEYKSFVSAYYERNKKELLAPEGTEKLIEDMQAAIDDFESEIDLAISEANIKATIHV